MRHGLIVVLLVLLVAACSSEDVTIVNSCRGSWARIADGRGNTKVARLEYGDREHVKLVGETGAYNDMVLVADFRRLSDNQFLGTASQHFSPQSGSAVGIQESEWELTCSQYGGTDWGWGEIKF